MEDNYERNVYIIPGNVADSGGIFGGRIRTRNFVEAGLIGAVQALVWWLVKLPITSYTAKAVLFMILVPVPVLAAIIGARDESLLQFLMEFIAFRRKRRKMVFRIPRMEEKTLKEKRKKEAADRKTEKKKKKQLAKEEKRKKKSRKKRRKDRYDDYDDPDDEPREPRGPKGRHNRREPKDPYDIPRQDPYEKKRRTVDDVFGA